MADIPRLTLKKAKQLAMQEFGTAKGLEPELGYPAGFFAMEIGNLEIRIRPYFCGPGRDNLFEIAVRMKCGIGVSRQLHDPETLKQDFEAEERYREEERREIIRKFLEETDG